MNVANYMYIAGILHYVDLSYTLAWLKKRQNKYDNIYELEYNYHKFFFKKFGLFKGGFLSSLISTPLVMGIIGVSFYIDVNAMYFVLGMLFMIAYMNFMSYVKMDEINTKVTLKK